MRAFSMWEVLECAQKAVIIIKNINLLLLRISTCLKENPLKPITLFSKESWQCKVLCAVLSLYRNIHSQDGLAKGDFSMYKKY